MAQHGLRIGMAPIFNVKQPYFVKHSPINPFLGSVHDGISTEYLQGYSVKPMHWLYRFRWNVSPYGGTTLYLRNPGGKVLHWLEVSIPKKLAAEAFSNEFRPHLMTAIFVVVFTTWQLARYAFFHPELSFYGITVYPTKNWITQYRFNERHPMDKPVFRYFQRCPEFYSYDAYRDLIKMGVIANDPYVAYMQKIGKEKDLILYADERGWGEGGRGKIVDLLPREWRAKHGKYAEHAHKPGHH